MTQTALCGAQILSGEDWLAGHALVMEDGRIVAIIDEAGLTPDMVVTKLRGGWLLPGFIDVQVNGGGGALFNAGPSIKVIETIAAAHRAFGTTLMLPTLISDTIAQIDTAMRAVENAIEASSPGIAGIHIEGPFLNPQKRGIHDESKICQPDDAAINLLCSLKRGKTLVTLAPEMVAPGTIRRLSEAGVIVAAGHSLATYEQIQAAQAEGLSGVTHLFNAMSQLSSRAPGLAGATLESDLFAGIIADGHHVHPASLRIALAAKGAHRLMLVTDAMPCVGAQMDSFMLGDEEIQVRDGICRGADGTLGGSSLDMASALRNAVQMMGADLRQAAQMASLTPARFLGLEQEYGRIMPGYRADLVHLDAELNLSGIWQGGRFTG